MTSHTVTATTETHDVHHNPNVGLLHDHEKTTVTKDQQHKECHGRSLGRWASKRFPLLVLLLQLLLIIFFAIFADYAVPAVRSTGSATTTSTTPNGDEIGKCHAVFQDVHLVLFIGFAFLSVFLRKYGYSALGLNLLIAAFVIQLYFILSGLLRLDVKTKVIPLDVNAMIRCEFAALAVIIVLGALWGKLRPGQYLIVSIFATIFYALTEYLIYDLFQINDPGRVIAVHLFGAFFGLTVARIIYKAMSSGHENENSYYHLDIMATLGTLLLWVFWPSVNAAHVACQDGELYHRVIVNTYLALLSSCLTTYALSALFNHGGKLDILHIQNASLAGGVAIAALANLLIYPFGALLIGAAAGALNVIGLKFCGPFLLKRLKFHDTRSVTFLHGVPALLGALTGAVLTAFVTKETYGDKLYTIFPGMKAPPSGTGEQQPRTAANQAGIQAAGVGIALGMALIGGLITGFLMRIKFCRRLACDELYNDLPFWRISKKAECHCPHSVETELHHVHR